MPIKTILSVCSPDQSDQDLRATADLCAEAQAHLSLLMVAIAEPPPTGEYAVELAVEWHALRRKALAEIADKAERVSEVLGPYGLSFDVASLYEERGSLDDAIGLRAHYSDLVLLDRGLLATSAAVAPLVEGALFKSARAVLVVPAGFAPTVKPKTVIVAWDSGIESARAVQSALDLLCRAQDVRVVLVDPVAADGRNGGEPGADVATYLARHGLAVTVERIASGGLPVADVLRQHARDVNADLLVMGAYGHSRLRERIFGGTTRALIDKAELPILMAH